MKDAHSLLTRLAVSLAGKQVESEAISEALGMLCEHFSFESGFVYEVDQHNRFCLKERLAPAGLCLCEAFPVDALAPGLRQQLSEEPLTVFTRSVNRDPEAQTFLDLFGAASLVAVSLVDEKFRINGWIVFVDTKKEHQLSAAEREDLEVVLSVLGRAAGVRILQNKLGFAQTSLENILDNTGIDIYLIDFFTYEILYANRSMAEPYGGVAEFLGRTCWQVLFPGQEGPCAFCPKERLIDEEGNPTKVYSWDYQRPFDGSWFRVFSAAFRWVDGRLAHLVSSADITENKQNEALIEYMANYEALTGLPNRRMLVRECKRRIERAAADDKGYVLFFDIDGFKAINDTFGHDAGDEFLVSLGSFFSGIPLLKDAFYRNGGDEFVAILDGAISEEAIRHLVRFIHERFKKSWRLKNGEVLCNTSVGVACYPEDGETAEDLLNLADQAMYSIKKRGGGGLCFARELKAELPA